jgi:N6-adenosine-specific RNA methylase IME4
MITSDFNALPRRFYRCIVTDNPWEYQSKRTGGNFSSGARQKYSTMSLEQLASIPVKEIAFDDAVMFMWITTPLKDEIIQSGLIHTWGFAAKTTLYWIKTGRLGLGYWWRGNVEECLVCVRGNVTPFRESTKNIIEAPPGEHSAKPEAFWNKIEPVIAKWNLNPKLEMFSRSARPGWDAFGFEANGVRLHHEADVVAGGWNVRTV